MSGSFVKIPAPMTTKSNGKNGVKDWTRPSVGQYYVFLETLKEDDPQLWASAKALTDLQGEGQAQAEISARMNEALTMLDRIITNERVKEINFMNKFQTDNEKMLPELAKLRNGKDFNYYEFTRQINYAINGIERTKQIVENEQKRELVRQQFINKTLSQQTLTTTQAFKSYAETFIKSLNGTSRGTANINLREFIMEQIQNNLQQKKNNIKTMDDLIAIFTTGFTLSLSAQQLSENKIFDPEAFIKLPEYQQLMNEMVKAFSEDAKEHDQYIQKMENMFDRYGFRIDLGQGQTSLKDRQVQEIKQMKKNLPNKAQDLMQKMKNITTNISIINQKGIGSEILNTEIQEAVIKSLGKFGLSENVGKTQTKTDTFTFATTFDLEYVVESGELKPVLQLVNKMINEDIEEEYSKYPEQNRKFNDSYTELREILENKNKQLNRLEQSFIIHSNIKDYSSYSRNGGPLLSSFSGGTDWKLAAFIPFLQSLFELGFKSQDVGLIEQSILNCLPGTIMGQNKNPVENFISIFIAFTLFSDGITMAQEVAQGIANDTSALNVLHLFLINNVYIPASVLLERMYEELTQSNNSILSSVHASVRGGLKTKQISSYLANLDEQGIARWEKFREEEYNATSIKLRFLGNFFDIIDKLNS